jgi:outer membrane lipopolysaccharide assembly protein LptE/RlpB
MFKIKCKLITAAFLLTTLLTGCNYEQRKEVELKERELAQQTITAEQEKKVEKIVRQSEMVTTQSGSDGILHSLPNKNSKELESLNDVLNQPISGQHIVKDMPAQMSPYVTSVDDSCR